MNNERRIKRIIESHNAYWNEGITVMSDSEYDKEIEWLKTVEPDHWLLSTIGGTAGKVKHNPPMLSLNKAYTFEEIKKFVKKTARNKNEQYICQAKFDGLAAKLENGVLSTRGDGKFGENISSKMSGINFIYGKKNNSIQLGEIVCSYITFRIQTEYKHPRNYVAGLINSKKKISSESGLAFVEYDESPKIVFTAQDLTIHKWAEIIDFFEEYDYYPKDGIVIKLADKEYGETLGKTEHHPLSAIAFKFANEQTESVLLEVEWQPGKNKLTPVAIIKPVVLGGVTITKATLHNFETVANLDLHIGDKITIERSGDVIPHILTANRTENSKKKVLIVECPVCRSVIDFIGKDVRCTNPSCRGKIYARLLAQIKEFEIDFIGETNVKKIVNQIQITDMMSFIKVTKKQLIEAGIGEKNSEKILQSISAKTKSLTAERFLAALNIEGIGRSTWKQILKIIPFDKLVKEKISMKELLNIDGVGLTTARKIRQGLLLNKKSIQETLKVVNIVTESDIRSCRTVCFTGKMPEKRSFYEEIAKRNGMMPVDTVSKELNLLVVSEVGRKSSKVEKAEKLGIQIVELDKWLEDLK